MSAKKASLFSIAILFVSIVGGSAKATSYYTPQPVNSYSYYHTTTKPLYDYTFNIAINVNLRNTYDSLQIVMGQCHSGGFVDDLAISPANEFSIATSCRWDRVNYACKGEGAACCPFLLFWEELVERYPNSQFGGALPAWLYARNNYLSYSAEPSYNQDPQYFSRPDSQDLETPNAGCFDNFIILALGDGLSWRHWNELARIHNLMTTVYGYSDSKIYVYAGHQKLPDGSNAPSWVDGDGSKENILNAISSIGHRLSGWDRIFIWFYGHGALATPASLESKSRAALLGGTENWVVSLDAEFSSPSNKSAMLDVNASGVDENGIEVLLNNVHLGYLDEGTGSTLVPVPAGIYIEGENVIQFRSNQIGEATISEVLALSGYPPEEGWSGDEANTNTIYAGGSNPNVVYRFHGGTSWETISQDLGSAVLCLCEYNGHLYAGTGNVGGTIGQVWRYDGNPNWTLVGNNLDIQVCSLIVFRGKLYAGTAYPGRIYRYESDTNWMLVDGCESLGFGGFRCMYVWNDVLYIGNIGNDRFGHYDGETFTLDADFGGSCIWDLESYDSNLYASAYAGIVYKSSNGHTWTTIRGGQSQNSWELGTFQGHLYVTTGPKLERYDGTNFSLIWTEPDNYEIISMVNAGDALILGTGKEAGSGYGVSGIGRVYAYDGSAIYLISGDMGNGIQSLYAAGIGLVNLTDDVNNDDCVAPGRDINYTIDYNYPAGPNLPDINDVNIVDYLPAELEFVSASNGGSYDSNSHTVIWNIGMLSPGSVGSVTLRVKVKCLQPDRTITNECKIRSSGRLLGSAYEYTPVCNTTFTNVYNIAGCVSPGNNVTYNICYAANGYGDTDVMITDVLPDAVNYVSADHSGSYNPGDRTVTWGIGTLEPNESGCVELVVQVNTTAESLGTITNCCRMTGDCLDINACEYTPVCCWPVRIIYVDTKANGSNNGTSWVNAYKYLQDALTDAYITPGCEEIWVAEGTYRPDTNSAHPNGTSDREATFQLINGVVIYGGFPTGGGTWQDRNPAAYQTILSGDLLKNDRQIAEPCDLLNDPNRADNSYHVVTATEIEITQTTILDGFRITGGNANGDDPYDSGGGMYDEGGSPMVRNCTFTNNSAMGEEGCSWVGGGGGGMYGNDSNSMIINCLFKNNWANRGGGFCSDGGEPNITNCTFVGNGTDYGGGGITITYLSGARVTNCILWGNWGNRNYGNGLGNQITDEITVYSEDATNAKITYCDIKGGRPGVGNIDKDPMFGSDGYHLKMCSPCIDVGTNTPASGLAATDIDGQARIMNGQCEGEAIVDMGVDEYLPDCNAMLLLYAHCQSPTCGSTPGLYVGESPNVNLEWCPGLLTSAVNGQDVYFGTDYSGVYNATTATPVTYKGRQSATSYLATGLKAGATYYWRIDEVNNTNIWQGPVWSFTTGLIIDDFERYSGTNDMNANWKASGGCHLDQYDLPPFGTLSLVQDSAGKHANLHYDNTGSTGGYDYFSEVNRPYIGGTVFTGSSSLSVQPTAIRVDYVGAATNSANFNPYWNLPPDKMYVALEDTAGHIGVYYNPDANAVLETTWQQWYIPLNDPNFSTVNEAAILSFYLGIGVRCNDGSYGSGGDGNVMFDNIRLEPPVMPGYGLAADFTGDGFVNFNDFAVMGEEWHRCGKTDLNQDCFVDLMDLAILAEEWLK